MPKDQIHQTPAGLDYIIYVKVCFVRICFWPLLYPIELFDVLLTLSNLNIGVGIYCVNVRMQLGPFRIKVQKVHIRLQIL